MSAYAACFSMVACFNECTFICVRLAQAAASVRDNASQKDPKHGDRKLVASRLDDPVRRRGYVCALSGGFMVVNA